MSITATSEVAVTPPVTVSAYTAGFVMGGIMKFAGLLSRQQTGLVQSVMLKFKSAQTTEFVLYLFSASPIGTFADHGAPAINAADVPLIVARVDIPAANAFSELGSGYTHYEVDNIGKAMAPGVVDLWGVLIAKSTPTPGGVADLTVSVACLKDV